MQKYALETDDIIAAVQRTYTENQESVRVDRFLKLSFINPLNFLQSSMNINLKDIIPWGIF